MWRRIGQWCLMLSILAAVPVVAAQSGPMPVPENLRAPQQNVVQFRTYATGVQVYVCKTKAGDPSAYEWTFKAPVAELWDERGEKVGTHYAGPTWEGNDGSKVVGEVVERAHAPDPSAIPWLLLRAKSNAGAGNFTPITYVQRLETVGGIAPSDGCDGSAANAERTWSTRRRTCSTSGVATSCRANATMMTQYVAGTRTQQPIVLTGARRGAPEGEQHP